MGFESEPVESGCRQAFVLEELSPVGKPEVGGDDNGQTLKDLGNEGEDELGAIGCLGDKSEFVQIVQVKAQDAGREFVKSMFILSQGHLVDQAGGGVEAHPVSLVTASQSQPGCQVGLALTRMMDSCWSM